MNSNKRKTGGAYRRKKLMISQLAKKGKDRTKANKQTPSKEIVERIERRRAI